MQHAKVMRLTGTVEFLDDEKLKKKVYEERRSLDDLAGQSIEPFIEVFRIKSGDVHFWTTSDVLKESQLQHLTF